LVGGFGCWFFIGLVLWWLGLGFGVYCGGGGWGWFLCFFFVFGGWCVGCWGGVLGGGGVVWLDVCVVGVWGIVCCMGGLGGGVFFVVVGCLCLFFFFVVGGVCGGWVCWLGFFVLRWVFLVFGGGVWGLGV